MENGKWKLSLNISKYTLINDAMRLMNEADEMLGLTKYGIINIDDIADEDKLSALYTSLEKFIQAKNIVDHLVFVDEKDFKFKKLIFKTAEERIVETEKAIKGLMYNRGQ